MKDEEAMQTGEPGVTIFYDGDCPVCANYVRFSRFREAVGAVRLVDVRENLPERECLEADGCDLDEGMVLEFEKHRYHGERAVHMMAVLSAPDTLFNRLNKWIFTSPRRSAALYPVLRAGRNLLLRLLGRRFISQDGRTRLGKGQTGGNSES